MAAEGKTERLIRNETILNVALKFGVGVVLAVFPFLVGGFGWGVLELSDHDNRITAIEASGYTAKDAKADQAKDAAESKADRVAADADRRAITSSLAKIETALAREVGVTSSTRQRLDQVETIMGQILAELRRDK